MSVEDTDVLVIGAGVSGLAAAERLHRDGREVRVVEARDRVGGRILSPAAGEDGAVDLGATWCWGNEPRIAALLETLDIARFEQYENGDHVAEFLDGPPRRFPPPPAGVASFRRLAWASTETATGAPGHLEGALEGAERAVLAVSSS